METSNIKFVKHYVTEPVTVAVLWIDPDTNKYGGEQFSPNTKTVAEASAWLMANGKRNFKIIGNEHFHGMGVELWNGDILGPGDYLVMESGKDFEVVPGHAFLSRHYTEILED